MPNLRSLDLSNNKFEQLAEMPELPSLETLDLQGNKLKDKECIFALAKYPKLQVVNMAGNPFAEELGEGLKAEILVELGTELKCLKSINEEEVTEDDITAANETRTERAKAKKEADEEAARAAAEAAAEAAAAAEGAPKEE